jgi:hypothetical membrane protein
VRLVSRRARAAVWSGATIVGVVAYAAIDLALVVLRPRFSVLHNAESDYGSRGAYSWVMDVNFVLRCGLSLAAVRALALVVRDRRPFRAGLTFLAVWAVASGLLGVFPDDPVGTKTQGAGKVHLLLAGVAFVAVVLGTRMVTRTLRREPAWRPIIAPLALASWGALVPVLLLAHAHLRAHSLGGLYEKTFLAIELLWFLVAAAWVMRVSRESAETVDGSVAANDPAFSFL